MTDSTGNSSSTSPRPSEAWGWTRAQRIVIGVLVFLLLVVLGVGYWRRPYRLDDPVVVVGGERVALAARVDPNRATLLELTRIPHVGEKLGEKIIAYREARIDGVGDHVVFRSAEDLGHVVGPKTLEQLRPYFQFPDEAEAAATMDAAGR
jgi:hypothetical protein